ncbi:hypothetical protein [Nonomuraea typhae]|uniref:PE domain-containing protein n=1 Tax=Nonomuraea typhae TaxID=2603600 RepID=A0ABW7Z8Z4_9ACTN
MRRTTSGAWETADATTAQYAPGRARLPFSGAEWGSLGTAAPSPPADGACREAPSAVVARDPRPTGALGVLGATLPRSPTGADEPAGQANHPVRVQHAWTGRLTGLSFEDMEVRQMSEILQQCHEVAEQSTEVAGDIQAFDATFAQAVARVQELVDASATASDRQILAVLLEASQAVRAAAEALYGAAKTAGDYADRV